MQDAQAPAQILAARGKPKKLPKKRRKRRNPPRKQQQARSKRKHSMCGILLLVKDKKQDGPQWYKSLQDVCARRGPHCVKTVRCVEDTVCLTSSVLSLRGDGLTSQPINSQDGAVVLAWNGQVYSVTNVGNDRAKHAAGRLAEGHNDGLVLMEWLTSALAEYATNLPRSEAFIAALDEVLSSIEAEWAMALVDTLVGTIYYGRDPIGRRSLLRGETSSSPLLLASTASREALDAGVEFQEVDCAALWAYDLATRETCPVLDRAPCRAILKERREPATFDEPTQAEREAALALTHDALLESVRQRVTSVRGQTRRDIDSNADAPPVAILFSGGLDSTLLAYYAHLVLPPHESIDLLNVAFENPRVLKAASASADGSSSSTTSRGRFDTPDRLLSRITTSHLRTLCPKRTWRLVEIDVTYSEYTSHNAAILATMTPSSSVMDLSLASVLYFASRGEGVVDGHEYTTPSRVYISGLGADELCGGYSRHRKAFDTGGWTAAVDELQMDLDRLHTRNLGRDDRILSSHSREARYPFLAVPFIELLASLPVRVKAELTLPLGKGEKYLLRELARKCGLTHTAEEKKRAMQFGARSAKMEVGQGKVKGHQVLGGQGRVQGHQVLSRPSSPPAPEEVFTTLCYFPAEYDMEQLLPEHLRARYKECSIPRPTDHVLYTHIPLLSAHMQRLQSANEAMQRTFPSEWDTGTSPARTKSLSPSSLLSTLQSHLDSYTTTPPASEQSNPRRVRLSLTARGEIKITQAIMPACTPSTTRKVRIDTQSTSPQNEAIAALQLHKTSSRKVYDDARARVGATLGMGEDPNACFDVLMWGSKDGKRYLTESSIANVLLECADGRIVTPRLGRGISFLPGLMRDHLLSIGLVEEADVTIEECQTATQIYLCNALRGLVPVSVTI